MGGGLQLVVGQSLEHVAHVDNEVFGQGFDCGPSAFLVHDFQSVRRCAHEQRDEVDVFVLAGANARIRF